MDPWGKLDSAEVAEFLNRNGITVVDDLFLYFDADGHVYPDAVFGDVLVWRDPVGRWHYVAVSQTFGDENRKFPFGSPLFPPGDDPFAWLKTLAIGAAIVGGVVILRDLSKE